VTRETKERFGAVARHQGLSDSGLLKRLVEMMLQGAGAANIGPVEVDERGARGSRVTVRIRPDDQLLLRERAIARGMPAATYLSVLTRAHLRGLSPLPKAEWLALEKSVSELSRLARNINQIATAANPGDRIAAPGQDYVQMMLKICTALRDNTKALLEANLKSWQQGYEEPK
jgi:hypothetical protein